MPTVLFVCTANICRSPMAMALFRQRVSTLPNHDQWHVESAGTWARDGRPAHLFSQQVVAERGMDIGQHRSRVINQERLQAIDLILTMEQGHKEAIRVEFPEAAQRVFTLSEMAGYDFDVPDPIGAGIDEYQVVARELERLLILGHDRIVQLAQHSHDPSEP